MVNARFAFNVEVRAIVVLSHGLSEGETSEFICLLADEMLRDLPVGVATYSFSFFRKEQGPSANLVEEVNDLKQALEGLPDAFRGLSRILVGKSIGAITTLKYVRDTKDSLVKAIISVGLPLGLGFPPDLQLLPSRAPRKPSFAEEYSALIKELGVPIVVVQGDQDDLCDLRDLYLTMRDSKGGRIEVVPGADHGFRNVQGEKLWEPCIARIVTSIREAIDGWK
jgi:pimeloyl-ACP methyl ester carboxylesterase